jgi:sugar phosphate isomerase/epimerase
MGSMLDLKKFKHACLDTSRVAQRREDLIRTYKSLQKFLVHVHISNVRTGKYYAPMEKGILPIESFLTKLKQDGFPGTVSLKLNGKFLTVGEDDKVMKALEEEKLFYDTYFTNVKLMPKTVDVPAEPDAKA